MLNVAQIILAIFVITVIVIQSKGGGLGASFGSGASYHTKRGAEKTIFFVTIFATIAFVVVAFLNAIS